MIQRVRHAHLLVLLAALTLTACTNLGPKAIRAGHSDYNDALGTTSNEQLLTNLVRLRYRDQPLFLEISAVTTQFKFSPSLTASGNPWRSQADETINLSGRIAYEETPTISYAPLQGENFARRLLTPISINALALLSHSGWSIERLLRICVQRVNGVPNAVAAAGPTPSEAPEFARFRELTGWLRTLQQSDDLSIGLNADGKAMLVFSERALTGSAYANVAAALGLPTGTRTFPLTMALRGDGRGGVGLQTRSLNGMLYYLAHAVDVPEAHIAAGLVTDTTDGRNRFDWSQLTGDIFTIRHADDPPGNAAVSVHYRGHWFYIADNDLTSKSTFSLLQQLFALQAGGGEKITPLITLPIGG